LVQSALLDILSNGVRIGFALVFLSSYLFGNLMQPFVGRVWEGMIESKKPFFTSIFGGIGAVFAVTKVLST
jgi:hypothetical protein